MNYSPILIVAGEPNSVFLEIFFKSLKLNKSKSPLILITSEMLLKRQMTKLNFKKKIRILNSEKLKKYKLNNNSINLINVDYKQKKIFEKISNKSNKFINESFSLAFKIIKKEKIFKFINGPISKKNFLNKSYLGMTEYIAQKFKTKTSCMLIYNKKLSVSPLTTHLPLRAVSKKLSKNLIIEKIKLINEFYKKQLKIKPHIAILGVNPHCESIYRYNEDEKIIKPAVNYLKKKKYLVTGPHSADTIFLTQNRKKYDVILGMYHDQVLTPIKTLYEYDAINITLGLPFIRISPDHGPNQTMLGKNLSNPLSLIRAINFLDKN
tara:strand:- start:118 stop:1083 length:966 start_codon:yes stop_codon:yes gene_type:complete